MPSATFGLAAFRGCGKAARDFVRVSCPPADPALGGARPARCVRPFAPTSSLDPSRLRDMAKPVFVLNGPNLNMLGQREPEVYGRETLEDVRKRTEARAADLGLVVDFRQSNTEGEIIGWIQEAREAASGIILNAGALTHSSIGILDALNAAELPVIEVHLSNIYRREEFRHRSYVSLAAHGVICGLGAQGYEFALEALAKLTA